MRKFLLTCLAPLLAGCAAAAPRPAVCRTAAPPAPPPTAVAFVANGSGDTRTVSTNLRQVVAEAGAPLEVEAFVWTHGAGRVLADHLDHCNHLEEGRRLAARVCEYRKAYPDRRVYLIGHSAGCAVVLAAAEQLPPGAVDRVVLLSPSVSTGYDLRPTLRAVRGGVDVYCSDRDRWVLGVGMAIVGTADHNGPAAAGRDGFTPVVECPGDAALYERLRQHPWDPAVEWTGNEGGHYGNNGTGFLRAYVLPLLTCDKEK
jgi:pimeloyl-ACP methyl ester carboxylesterase